MSSPVFHTGSSPDLFLIGCALISVISAIVIFRARSRRNATRRGVQK